MLVSSARERVNALDGRIEALSGRLDEVIARLDRFAANIDRLSSGLDQLQQRVSTQIVDHRGQADRLAVARREVARLDEQGRAVSALVADLQAGHRAAAHDIIDLRTQGAITADAIARQAGRLDSLHNADREQERLLDQVRVDVIRIERQAAADLSELRTTDMALARAVLKADAAEGAPAASIRDLGLPRRPDEAADQLPPPQPATLAVVEEEPAERQTP